MSRQKAESEILEYIIANELEPGDRLPSLSDLSQELDISVGKLREDLEVARHMGVVSVRPRLGIRRESYDFYPAVQASLQFGLSTGEATFRQYSQLRQSIEANMWHRAVNSLISGDKNDLMEIISKAWEKLRGNRVHIPNSEHRELHLMFFKRLDNPFVDGLLRAYWDAYFEMELSRYADYEYWIEVWTYHQRIVQAVCDGEMEESRQLLIEHFQLLPTVTFPTSS
jgi:DNA-binding FadR family transcriptional regulator